MERGDVILTPSWTWHDHGHEGVGPMIWLDGLDLPIYQALPVNFAQMYKESRYPSKEVAHSEWKFPWVDVQKWLDAQPGSYARYLYTVGDKKEHLSKIVGGHAERINAGTRSPQRQETSSFVFHVYQGSGYTLVGEPGQEKKLVWSKSDTFAVPHWDRIVHVADAGEDAYLFSFSDVPLLTNLGSYREKKF